MHVGIIFSTSIFVLFLQKQEFYKLLKLNLYKTFINKILKMSKNI